MNYRTITIMSLYLLTSCSSLKKQVTYSSIAGSFLGGVVGKELSPNKESDPFNTVIGAVSGAVIAGTIGYLLYEDGNPTKNLTPVDVKNLESVRSLDEYFLEEGFKEVNIPNSNIKVKEMTSKDIETLKKLGVRPVVPYFKEYQTENRVIMKGDKKIVIPAHKVYEQGVRIE